MRSKKGLNKVFDLRDVIDDLRPASRQERKKLLEHFFARQNRTEFENREHMEIPQNRVKSGHLGLQASKVSHFHICLKFVQTHVAGNVHSHVFLFFVKSEILL